jgi:hypothetical protein
MKMHSVARLLITIVWSLEAVSTGTEDIKDGLLDIQSLPGIAYTSITPTTFGMTVAAAGDVNGDKIADFITSDTTAAGGAGVVYVLFGSPALTSILVDDFVDSSELGFRIYGARSTDSAGRSIGGGVDINDDGFDDVMIGAVNNEVYFIFGHHGIGRPFSAVHLANWESGEKGFRISFSTEFSIHRYGFGTSVASAGDVNGDGYPDAIIGGPGVSLSAEISTAGIAYVLFGLSAGDCTHTPFTDTALAITTSGPEGFMIYGSAAWGYLGTHVAAAGDVNNDGFDDVLISSQYKSTHALSQNGAVYVIFGYSTVVGTHNIDLTTPPAGFGFSISGFLNYLQLPSAYSGVGDTNGDGIDDFVVTAGRLHGAGDAGACYVIYGNTALGDVKEMDLGTFTTGSAGYKFLATAPEEELGGSVAALGDITGDGRSDFIVGGLGLDVHYRSGSAVVVYGRASSRTSDLLMSTFQHGVDGVQIYGAAGSDTGVSVGGVGDVNADGVNDIFIGTHRNGSYVIFGGSFPSRKVPPPPAGAEEGVLLEIDPLNIV